MSKQSPNEATSITANNIKTEHVQHFNYLGAWLTSDGRCRKAIGRRINLSKTRFNSIKKNIFGDRELYILLKKRLLKCFVRPVLMYGCETWTLTAKTRKTQKQKCGSTAEFSAFHGKHFKLMYQSFKEWGKRVNCFVV